MNSMVRWNNIFCIAAALAAILASSCQREIEKPDLQSDAEFNLFAVSGYDYSIDMSLTRAQQGEFSLEEEGHLFTLTETPRGAMTRASFDDVHWDAHDSKVGIYLVEHLEDSEINAVPFDESKVKVVASSANLARKGNVISSSSVDLLEQVKYYVEGNPFKEKTVDAYAYFPYAEEITQTVALSNTSNSLIGMFNAPASSNVLHLPFTMKPTQTDDNIWFHDLMISVREGSNDFNKYGNIGKKNRSIYDDGGSIIGFYDLDEQPHDVLNNNADNSSRIGEITCDNIHMRMQHVFSRFTIDIKYDSRFENAKINRVFVDGTKVYSFGKINLLKGEVTPGGASQIDRLISDDIINGDIVTDMMLCPCVLDGPGQMVFHIIIDGVEYQCDLYKMGARKIKASHIYDLKFSFSTYSTLLVNNSYGGVVSCVQNNPGTNVDFGRGKDYPQNTYGGRPLDDVGDEVQWLVVAPRKGWDFDGIYVNGKRLEENTGTEAVNGPLQKTEDGYRVKETTSAGGYLQHLYYCKLDKISDKNTRYDVVCVPSGNWYAQPEHIIQHFDGIYNNGFNSIYVEEGGVTVEKVSPTDPSVTIWKDISGHGNDAQLQNVASHTTLQPWRRQKYDQTDKGSGVPYTQYETTCQSGWVEGGLKLDGINDYVTFPAVLPGRDDDPNSQDLNLTMELYICMERPQAARFPRILCEAEPGLMPSNAGVETRTTHGYPSFVFLSSSNDKGQPHSNNVLLYPSGASQIYFMGCGHNDGHHDRSGDKKDYSLAAPPDGDKIMHIVLWYRGGYGDVTDMSMFKSGHTKDDLDKISKDLGGGDPRNCLIAMVEYWDRSINALVRKTLSFHGNGAGEAEYRILLDDVFGAGVELNGVYDHERVMTRPLNKEIGGQNHDAYIEDPFVPTERWACIGGRPNDYTRQFNGTIFSFMVYDTLLSIAEIDHNRNLHFERFGAYKTNLE